MVKKTNLLIMSVMVLALSLMMMACASTPAIPIVGENPFLGSWKSDDAGVTGTITFNADGTGTYMLQKLTYTVDGNTAKVTIKSATPFLKPTPTTAIINGDILIFGGASFKIQE